MDFPQSVKNCLWSYDIPRLDRQKDSRLIILNVLNFGNKEASDWLFERYDKEQIQKTIQSSAKSEWGKKSLNFWSLILKASPTRETRFS